MNLIFNELSSQQNSKRARYVDGYPLFHRLLGFPNDEFSRLNSKSNLRIYVTSKIRKSNSNSSLHVSVPQYLTVVEAGMHVRRYFLSDSPTRDEVSWITIAFSRLPSELYAVSQPSSGTYKCCFYEFEQYILPAAMYYIACATDKCLRLPNRTILNNIGFVRRAVL